MSTAPASSPNSLRLYLRLLTHVRPYARWFVLAIGFLVVFSLSQAMIPALLKPMLDGTFVDRDPRFLLWAPIGIVVLFSLRGIANFISDTAFQWVAARVVFDLRSLLFDRYLHLPTSFFDNHSTGTLISRATFDTNRVASSATKILTTLVRDSLTLIGLIGYVIYLNWTLSLLVFCLFPLVGVMVVYMGRRLRRLHRQLQQDYGTMTTILEEAIKNHRIVKVFSGVDYESKRFHQSSNWVRRLQVKAEITSNISMPITETLSAIIIALIIYLGTSDTQNPLSVGGFMAFLTALMLMIPPIKNLTKLNGELQMGLAAAESVFAIMDEAPEPDRGQLAPAEVQGEVCFEAVGFSYSGQKHPVLHQLSFQIKAGQSLALVGPSGSGKSTTAALLPRYYNPVSGRILIDGQDIMDFKLDALRRHIAYVSQEVVLFNDTVANNICYGLAERPSMEALVAAARAAHALEFIERLPEGFDALVGENGVKLSGGQRQRLAIARAFLKDAPILILDEATSALDTESEQQVQKALAGLRKNRTTLIIAHRLSTIRDADAILVLQQGRVVERGTHQQLMAHNGLYAQLNQRQDAREDA